MTEQMNEAGFQQNVRAQAQQHNPLLNIRDRLFYALFCRVGLLYARAVPRYLQRTLEFILLFEALVALGMLTYIHVAFVREPVDCLHHVHDVWPKDGVLRVEIIKNASSDYTLLDSYRKLSESLPLPEIELSDLDEPLATETEILEAVDSETVLSKKNVDEERNETSVVQFLRFYLQPYFLHLKKMARMFIREDTYIVEYSLEYGFLRMTSKTRNRLNVTVMLVVLDPTKDECFAGWFSQMMLEEFLGYEDVLLSSLQQLAKQQNNSGFFRNVWSGDHYRFIEVSVSRLSYVAAAFLMMFFTLSISMLLRYAHQQIFLFIVDLLQVFDRNALVTFPLAPLLTAVLALIGVEALMSELFIEASTAFYVILIVWLADQYDVICCHTNISRRHWLRFFYLYHFVFYAYHYRFNGHFSSITLATSWLFIQHSMIYFFHHYELPAIIHQARVQRLLFHAQQQSLALQMSRRDNSDVVTQPESRLEQQANFGTVVAFLPENLSGRSRPSDGTTERAATPAGGTTERLGQQRDTWRLFSLPTFRFSNSLIFAQVFVRQPQESTQTFSDQQQSTQNEESTSQGTIEDLGSNLTELSETSSQSPSADVTEEDNSGCYVSTVPLETLTGEELSDDDSNLPQTLLDKMGEAQEPSVNDSLVLDDDTASFNNADTTSKDNTMRENAAVENSETQYYQHDDIQHHDDKLDGNDLGQSSANFTNQELISVCDADKESTLPVHVRQDTASTTVQSDCVGKNASLSFNVRQDPGSTTVQSNWNSSSSSSFMDVGKGADTAVLVSQDCAVEVRNRISWSSQDGNTSSH